MTNHTGAQMVPLSSIKPNKRNPNKHSKDQVAAIAKNIERLGWRVPITVSNRSGLIVRGHGRYQAAKLLGAEEAPVVFQDYATQAEEWADLIADNKLAEAAKADEDALAAMMAEIDEDTRELTGMASIAIQDALTRKEVAEDLERFDRLMAPEIKQRDQATKRKETAKVLVILTAPPAVFTKARLQELKNQMTPMGVDMDVIER